MKKATSVILILSALGFYGVGSTANSYVSEGHEYTLSCNENGYVFQSKYPVSRHIEAGANSKVIELNPEKIYLGKDCDAQHKVYGGGKWCWANGGISVEFALHNFGFPRQELSCEKEPESNCRC